MTAVATHALHAQRLAFPRGPVRMVLDTDAYNEIDDPFAIAYALRSPQRLAVEALYAAPFHNARSSGPGDGMDKSHEEILRVLQCLDVPAQGLVHRGATAFLAEGGGAVDSEAARDLVRRALASPADDPLYVVAIGAITNVASALLLEPAIAGRIVVVWLGGHGLHWPDTKEFNLRQDPAAARVVLDSGVPLWLVPCTGVTSHLLTTLPELQQHLGDAGAIGRFLVERLRGFSADHYAYSKVIWDIAAIAVLLDEGFTRSELVPTPVLGPDLSWRSGEGRPAARVVMQVFRDRIFGDLFRKLSAPSGQGVA